MKKRGLSMLLALVMILSLAAPALAAEDAFQAEEPAVQEETFAAPEEPVAPEEGPAEEAPVEELVSEPQSVEPISDEPVAAMVADEPMEAAEGSVRFSVEPGEDYVEFYTSLDDADNSTNAKTASDLPEIPKDGVYLRFKENPGHYGIDWDSCSISPVPDHSGVYQFVPYVNSPEGIAQLSVYAAQNVTLNVKDNTDVKDWKVSCTYRYTSQGEQAVSLTGSDAAPSLYLARGSVFSVEVGAEEAVTVVTPEGEGSVHLFPSYELLPGDSSTSSRRSYTVGVEEQVPASITINVESDDGFKLLVGDGCTLGWKDGQEFTEQDLNETYYAHTLTGRLTYKLTSNAFLLPSASDEYYTSDSGGLEGELYINGDKDGDGFVKILTADPGAVSLDIDGSTDGFFNGYYSLRWDGLDIYGNFSLDDIPVRVPIGADVSISLFDCNKLTGDYVGSSEPDYQYYDNFGLVRTYRFSIPWNAAAEIKLTIETDDPVDTVDVVLDEKNKDGFQFPDSIEKVVVPGQEFYVRVKTGYTLKVTNGRYTNSWRDNDDWWSYAVVADGNGPVTLSTVKIEQAQALDITYVPLEGVDDEGLDTILHESSSKTVKPGDTFTFSVKRGYDMGYNFAEARMIGRSETVTKDGEGEWVEYTLAAQPDATSITITIRQIAPFAVKYTQNPGAGIESVSRIVDGKDKEIAPEEEIFDTDLPLHVTVTEGYYLLNVEGESTEYEVYRSGSIYDPDDGSMTLTAKEGGKITMTTTGIHGVLRDDPPQEIFPGRQFIRVLRGCTIHVTINGDAQSLPVTRSNYDTTVSNAAGVVEKVYATHFFEVPEGTKDVHVDVVEDKEIGTLEFNPSHVSKVWLADGPSEYALNLNNHAVLYEGDYYSRFSVELINNAAIESTYQYKVSDGVYPVFMLQLGRDSLSMEQKLEIVTTTADAVTLNFDESRMTVQDENGTQLKNGDPIYVDHVVYFELAEHCRITWLYDGTVEFTAVDTDKFSYFILQKAPESGVLKIETEKAHKVTANFDANIRLSYSDPRENITSGEPFYLFDGEALYAAMTKGYRLKDTASVSYYEVVDGALQYTLLPKLSGDEVTLKLESEIAHGITLKGDRVKLARVKWDVVEEAGEYVSVPSPAETPAYQLEIFDYELNFWFYYELDEGCTLVTTNCAPNRDHPSLLELRLLSPSPGQDPSSIDEVTISAINVAEEAEDTVSLTINADGGLKSASYDNFDLSIHGDLTAGTPTIIPSGTNVTVNVDGGYKVTSDLEVSCFELPPSIDDRGQGTVTRQFSFYFEMPEDGSVEAWNLTVTEDKETPAKAIQIDYQDNAEAIFASYKENYVYTIGGDRFSLRVKADYDLAVNGGEVSHEGDPDPDGYSSRMIDIASDATEVTITTSKKPEPTATPAPTAAPWYPPYEPDPTATPAPTASPEPGTSPAPGTTPEPGPSAAPAPTPVTPPASGEGWAQNANGDWFFYENGVPVTNQWAQDGNAATYLGDDGRMVSGLVTVDDGTARDGTYYFSEKHDGSFGHMVTGWRQVQGEWYFFNDQTGDDHGKMVSNQWQADGNTWNFLGSDGKMQTGLQEVVTGESFDGWYYLNPKHDGTFGTMLTGWQQVGSDWYFFNDKHDGTFGRMTANQWQADGDTWNHLGPDGKMQTGLTWVQDGRSDDGLYYLNPFHDGTFGTMLTGWHTIDGYRYFFENRHNGLFGLGYVNGTFTIDGRSYTFDEHGRLIDD